jgi:hypothetical protein
VSSRRCCDPIPGEAHDRNRISFKLERFTSRPISTDCRFRKIGHLDRFLPERRQRQADSDDDTSDRPFVVEEMAFKYRELARRATTERPITIRPMFLKPIYDGNDRRVGSRVWDEKALSWTSPIRGSALLCAV